ncbi:hypothetical protein SNE26_19515 [Mucilaginibacter sp. cycad4]|uniref:hypothetical protein n=1 Tax=Mucilaginibacter sp. cycad4 TaxID=3342096 RepID=UPI002AAC1E3E|nr:hypothetical protein [Mucilaginibacter gossypii]WPU98215.1 hypothetical protein SNE26_19515 [Mucilaginibacter gossypii]
MKKIYLFLLFALISGLSNTVKAQTKVTIYQYYNATHHKHFYTNNLNELGPNGSGGFVYQGSIGQLYAEFRNSPTDQTVYRFVNPNTGAHYYTIHVNTFPSGFSLEGVLGYIYGTPFAAPQRSVKESYSSTYQDYYYSPNDGAPTGYILNGEAFKIY